nr:KrmB [uncultured bacterium]
MAFVYPIHLFVLLVVRIAGGFMATRLARMSCGALLLCLLILTNSGATGSSGELLCAAPGGAQRGKIVDYGWSLMDQDGREFAIASTQGQVTVLFFGFSRCRGVCPNLLAKMARAEAELGDKAEGVGFVMVSVDGDNDRPKHMKALMRRYSKRFVGLTAAPDIVAPIAKKYGVAFKTSDRPGDDGLLHSGHIVLLNQQACPVQALPQESSTKALVKAIRSHNKVEKQ